MGSAASAENRSRLQNADRRELLNIWQDLSEEHRQLLLKALEVKDTKEIKESASKDADAGKEQEIKASSSDAHGQKDIKEDVNEEQKEIQGIGTGVEPKEKLQHLEEAAAQSEGDSLKDSLEQLLARVNRMMEPDMKEDGTERQKETRTDAQEEQVPKEENKITVASGFFHFSLERMPRTHNLRDYFEKHYRHGGELRHPDYEKVPDADLHTWMHRPTGIQVWQDAIDLTSGEGGEVYFHYTSELAFRNITAQGKKTAEVWASLNSHPGPKQNAWWGKGVYSVPKPPDEWRNREQLLDNNFRNMMLRDGAACDKGPEYVQEEYPKRAAFCVPILIDPADAYDISIRATPEMQAAGKAPGVNLGNKLLNEPGKPPRCCVVLRVNGEDGVTHAQGQLLDALRRRAASANISAKYRLGDVLTERGLYEEALPVMQQALELTEAKEGPGSENALVATTNLAALLQQMGRHREALDLQRRVLESEEAIFGRQKLLSINNLAATLQEMSKYDEALEFQQKALDISTLTLGMEHPHTLSSMNNAASLLYCMDEYSEAAEMYQQVLKMREKVLGAQHPDTLMSMRNLGMALNEMGEHAEAVELLQNALEIMEKTLGAEHPYTLHTIKSLEIARRNMANREEAAKEH